MFASAAWAQSDPSGRVQNDTAIVYLSARDLCSSYQVDGRIFDDENRLSMIMDSLQQVQPNAYPLMVQWCRQQRMRINRMSNSLKNDYTREGDNI